MLQCLLRPALGEPQKGHPDVLQLHFQQFFPFNLVVMGQSKELWTVSNLFPSQVHRLQHGIEKNMPPRDKRFSNGQLQDTSKHDSCDAFFNWYFLNVVPWMYCSTLFWFALRYIPTCFCLGPGLQTESQSFLKASNCRQSIWQRLQPWVRSTQTWLLYICLVSLSQDYVAEEISQWTWFMFNSL